jgi:hypothetical protein
VAAISASGIAIISLTAPDAPAAVCVATYDTPGTAYAVTLDKDHNLAYVADGSNLQIVEIKPPALTLAGSCSPYTLATNLTIDNSYVYLAEELDRKLDIINVASPSSPLVAATYSSTGWGRIYATAIKDNYAYVANGTDGLSILNISTPSSPAFVSQCKTSAEARDVVVNGNYAYVADATSGLQTIDISNPSAPLLVDSDDTAGNANAIAICGDYLYVADWTGGLQIFDIVAPSNPAWVANYSTDWASDVFIDDHYVYVAARSSGLYILDITNPLTPSLVIHYNPASIIYGVWADGPYALLAAGESGLEVVFLYLP